jgi:hypothetical protein
MMQIIDRREIVMRIDEKAGEKMTWDSVRPESFFIHSSGMGCAMIHTKSIEEMIRNLTELRHQIDMYEKETNGQKNP